MNKLVVLLLLSMLLPTQANWFLDKPDGLVGSEWLITHIDGEAAKMTPLRERMPARLQAKNLPVPTKERCVQESRRPAGKGLLCCCVPRP